MYSRLAQETLSDDFYIFRKPPPPPPIKEKIWYVKYFFLSEKGERDLAKFEQKLQERRQRFGFEGKEATIFINSVCLPFYLLFILCAYYGCTGQKESMGNW
jgi:hypothetical protein